MEVNEVKKYTVVEGSYTQLAFPFLRNKKEWEGKYSPFTYTILLTDPELPTCCAGMTVSAQDMKEVVPEPKRAMLHLTAGDDKWTPTGRGESLSFEVDPLGGWVSTRNAVQAVDQSLLSPVFNGTMTFDKSTLEAHTHTDVVYDNKTQPVGTDGYMPVDTITYQATYTPYYTKYTDRKIDQLTVPLDVLGKLKSNPRTYQVCIPEDSVLLKHPEYSIADLNGKILKFRVLEGSPTCYHELELRGESWAAISSNFCGISLTDKEGNVIGVVDASNLVIPMKYLK